jgi:hypothetical protein
MSGEYEIYGLQLPLPGTLTTDRVIDVIYGVWGGMVHDDDEDEKFKKIEAVLYDQTWAIETMAKTFFAQMTSISYYWLESTIVRACTLPMLVRERV